MSNIESVQVLLKQSSELLEQVNLLSRLLDDIQQFNGPKFIRVLLFWRRCTSIGVSPFITRGELKEQLARIYGMHTLLWFKFKPKKYISS